MKKRSANKQKDYQAATVKEFLHLTDIEADLIELRLLVLEKFPTAEVVKFSGKGIEFLLATVDENLNLNLQKLFKLDSCRFSLLERTKDRKIRVVLLI